MALLQEFDSGTPIRLAAESVTLTIDGREVSVPKGTSVMAAASLIEATIPRLCATDSLKAFGSCRLCLVEIEGRPSLKVDMVYTDVEDTVFLPTATIAIRAIPEVVAAPPGVLIEPVFGAWNASSKSSASVRIT